MEPTPILDPRVRRYLAPSRIVWKTDGDAAPIYPEALLDPKPIPVIGHVGPACVMEHKGESGAPGLLLDFGREIHGGIQLFIGDTKDGKPVVLRVRFGESVTEAMGTPNNDHAIHDTTCLVPWQGTCEVGNTGFRFVRIDLVEQGALIKLKAVRAVMVYRDLKYEGSFNSSDERLNKIWAIGAYTVHLCMQDYLWDGIKRDRLIWVGDMHPMTQVISSVFGAHDIVPRSLDAVRNATALPQWMNGISSYSLWWIIIQHDWFRYHGNFEYLDEQRFYLLELLTLLSSKIDEAGSETLDGMRFLDWPTFGNDAAVHAGLHALLTWALRDGARLCGVLGEIKLREKCAAVREACAASVARLEAHAAPLVANKQAAALSVIAGLGDADRINADLFAPEPLRGLSTFYGYYMLQARARARDYEGCMDMIRHYWGTMLDRGATTFWEDFDIAWTYHAGRIDELTPDGFEDLHADFGAHCYKGLRHSLCHGWAAGPTAWLSEHVLGITPASPGFATIRVKPRLGDLEFVSGNFPTPLGIVHVRHEKRPTGAVKSQIDTPEGMKVVP